MGAFRENAYRILQCRQPAERTKKLSMEARGTQGQKGKRRLPWGIGSSELHCLGSGSERGVRTSKKQIKRLRSKNWASWVHQKDQPAEQTRGIMEQESVSGGARR